MAAEAHVLLQIVDREMVTPHHLKITFPVAYDDVGPAFHQNSESMGIVSEAGEKSVQQYQAHASAECGEKSRRAVDSARKHGGENNQQNGVERSLARK